MSVSGIRETVPGAGRSASKTRTDPAGSGGDMNSSAATKPPRLAADAETLEQLEFAATVAVVAERARSAPGADRILARRPTSDRALIEAELTTVAELASLLGEGDRFCAVAIEDLRSVFDRIRVPGSVLDPAELIGIADAIDAMLEVQSGLRRIAADAPRTAALEQPVPPATLAKKLRTSFEPDGSLADDASPQLKRVRQVARRTRNQLVAFLEKKLRDAGTESVDGNVTLRGGRYVMPVRRDARGRVSGIVHGESASGATVFVEPTDAVPLGNELQSAEAEQRREELRVLRDLTDRVREYATELSVGWEMCVAVDDLYARARYAVDVKATAPRLEQAPAGLRIRSGRHPLLLAELEVVVPFDLEVDGETRVVLISGPNTGGKTVLLKAVGLLCAMAQAGIIPPVGEHTVLPVFDNIESDIGDHQSIAASLSTFSAHIKSLRRVLERADASTLILLDEFGTGTDPVEGAALASAILQYLVRVGSFAIATTHLGQLKRLASETAGIENASLHFDPDRLEPSYQFSLGIPGRSYGLAMARSLGLPPDIVAAAESLQPDSEQSVDALLADLEERDRELGRREDEAAGLAARLAAERDGLDVLRADLDQQTEQLKAARKQLETEGRETARQYLLQARKRVEEALGMARAAVDETTARAARRLVEEGVQEEATAIDQLEEQAQRLGWRVVRSDRNRPPASPQTPPPPRRRRPTAPATVSEQRESSAVVATTELDLRGMTGDEAERVLLKAMDAAVVEDLPSLRVIHGKGTGALRERVSAIAQNDPRVSSYHTGLPQEGGTGVTIVEFKG